ncbi:MAG: cofactor assembly of complex C subunit B [Cyanobacteriota bacterium]|nr:cofactor assembly of complex C subunit B [Cyanobacteriota bacterium]
MAPPLPARVVLVVGLGGLLVAVANQLSAPQLDPPLERASVLASLLAVVLLVVAALWQRVVPEAAARADLSGEEGCELVEGLPDDLVRELGWGSAMILGATPAATLLVHDGRRTLLRRGLLGTAGFTPGPICRQALSRQRAISLVDLRPYPGRAEFDDLLAGLPSVVVQPIGEAGVLLVGGWSARCFSASDLFWIDGWARRLKTQWAPVWREPSGDLGAQPAREPEPG